MAARLSFSWRQPASNAAIEKRVLYRVSRGCPGLTTLIRVTRFVKPCHWGKKPLVCSLKFFLLFKQVSCSLESNCQILSKKYLWISHYFVSCMDMALCMIFTILPTLWNSEQKNGLLINFFVFHLILMKLGEVVVIHVYYNFTKFHQNRMKNKKVLLIARFSVQNFKVSVELWKSYIVHYTWWHKYRYYLFINYLPMYLNGFCIFVNLAKQDSTKWLV